jgi:FkbM family methyltransferase
MRLGTRGLGIVVCALAAVGCPPASEEPTREGAAAPAEAVAPQGTAAVDERPDRLLGHMGRIQQQIQNAPGRTGILAEKKRYSVFDEELIIRDFFQDRRGGFYLDVGCAWANKANNTYYLEKHLGWTGIGVDALADYAAGWAEHRPRSRFANYLVTDHAGTEDSFYTSESSPGLSSTDRGLAAGNLFGDNVETVEVKVPSITLDLLLEQEGVEKIDLLSMDIEGHEPQALAGFDIERFQPELVVIEGKDPEVRRYLESHGYALIERYEPFDLVNRYFAPAPAGEDAAARP